jgi:hypothetical protein
MKESNKVTNVGYLELNGKEVTLEQFYEGVETATSVVVSGCSDLKSLTANAATDVDVSYCSALKRFENENLKLIANSTCGLFVSKDGLYSAGCAQNLTLDEALNRLDRDDERAIIFTSAILTHLDN